jgi:DNA-binding NarL/FixJ family response regulator
MTARSLERAKARSHTAGAHAIPTRTVASRELFGVLADAQRVTVVSAPAGRTPRSVRTAHASLISDIRDFLSGRTPPAPPGEAEPLLEPLSESELRVLRYLPTNLPVPEIASELVVSANIRTHTRHVYDKLDVHTRAEAVERARELGLLAPTRAAGSDTHRRPAFASPANRPRS